MAHRALPRRRSLIGGYNEIKFTTEEKIMEGYCVKCRKKRSMSDVMKKMLGTRMQIKGLCSVCKTKMSTFAKK